MWCVSRWVYLSANEDLKKLNVLKTEDLLDDHFPFRNLGLNICAWNTPLCGLIYSLNTRLLNKNSMFFETSPNSADARPTFIVFEIAKRNYTYCFIGGVMWSKQTDYSRSRSSSSLLTVAKAASSISFAAYLLTDGKPCSIDFLKAFRVFYFSPHISKSEVLFLDFKMRLKSGFATLSLFLSESS